MENELKIAVIDDGINPSLCPNLLREYDLYVTEDGTVRRRLAKEEILTDHGTTCAGIICRYATAARLCSLRIFDTEELKTNLCRLLSALEWCLKENIAIVHLSVGSTQYFDYPGLRKITAKLIMNGQILVAAYCNHEADAIPAGLMGVLGVAADPGLKNGQYYIEETAIWKYSQIYASARHKLPFPYRTCEETPVFNSYAAPVITAAVWSLLEKDKNRIWSVPEIYAALCGRPVSIFRLHPDFAANAVVYCTAESGLLEDCFSFTVERKASTPEELEHALEDCSDAAVVVVPAESKEEEAYVRLLLKEKRCRGILYAGEYSFDFETKGTIFWDERQYKNLLGKIPKTECSEDIASVFVSPGGDKAVRIVCGLKMRLEAEGYPCLVISDYPKAYLYGIEYLPPGIALKSAADFFMNRCSYAVAVYLVSCVQPEKCDMNIELWTSESIHIEGSRILFPQMPTESDMDLLYQFVTAP